jgi:hypothetical protein
MPGGGAREALVAGMVQRFGGGLAFLCGVISRGGRRAGPGASQPYLGPRGAVAAPAT